ncbi:MAG: DUF2459 domain-containing protein [Sphingomonadaceae bacterium]|uniref:DUF2459 domain-containing protein n=1 Tax=Thermaurantiacus sp. TaxID=2820283 RepID=UPI00298F3605|nr:DUF2459 domain-containing protein [Thermaurantiacus sp.]MCS6986997.1 DUF2459 domain-containing protein [Sphingomonadaceae bacterium]MDW8415665.1 DUF2459 domain-containing protein [Thermaurantiacus sp.]
MTRRWRRRTVPAAFGALILPPLVGALVPDNPGWRPAPRGVEIRLDHSPVHTWLVLPMAAAGHDWRTRIPVPDTRAPRLAFSWGERDFFLHTPSWAEVDWRRALRAVVGRRPSLVHVEALGPEATGRPIRLSPQAYRRLAAWIEAEIAPGPPLPGYGPYDLFLPGRSRYSGLRTCNQWIRDALAHAGVTVGLWTPLPQGLIWRFPKQG